VLLNANTPQAATAVEYPPPPRVHWTVLLLAWFVLFVLIASFTPPAYQVLLVSLVADAWAFRLCLWIRSLDTGARSPFWCDVAIVAQLGYVLLGLRQNRSPAELDIQTTLGLATFFLSLWTIYLIRSDLLRHYNQREPYGLELNGALTYFFSFLYFQAKLYPIARAKSRAAHEHKGNPLSG
jgi:hypothetical protein